MDASVDTAGSGMWARFGAWLDVEHSASKRFMVSAALWALAGTVFGLLAATEYLMPDLVHGVPQLQFGRLRPTHINAVAFGFLSMANIGAILYVVPELCRTKLSSERAANILMIAWNAVMIGMVLCLTNGITEGREYAEMPWFLDLLVMGALALYCWIVWSTILNRKEKQLYVSLWYIAGTTMWFPIVYLIGNKVFFSVTGIGDAIANWFYGHNILGLWFTTNGIGLTYYFLPKITKNPLYSHLLSIVGFSTIAMFYTPTGTHHLLQSPVPEWLKAVAVISSIMLLVPVMSVLVNFWLTMKGKWGMMAGNLPLRFLITGMWFYMLTCFTGPFQATRWINWYLHFTHWVVGHAHFALLGTFGFVAWGAIYYCIPRVTGRQWYSRRLATAHYWLSLVGTCIMIIALTVAGLTQAAAWEQGAHVYRGVLMVRPFMAFRAFSGLLIVLGQVLWVYNIIKTVWGSETLAEEPLEAPLPQQAQA
ncbi:MAG: cbb3-type cytochrome c oxidase subunit I [Acidobacteria bacterium]|nr:cbb3-type cytochrome c oxidase subunit I [Acidobacteriota bacterium]